MPNICRTILCMEVLVKQSSILYGLKDLLHSYFVMEHEGEKWTYMLVWMSGPKLVLDLPTYDPEWKDTFFFASPEILFGLDTDLASIFHKPGE